MSLVVRFVETPERVDYGFGAPVLVAGLMLMPFSLASFAASKAAARLARRTSSEAVVAAGCVVLIASMVLFLLARGAYWEIILTMALAGFGVGCVYAVNPLQITGGVPSDETGPGQEWQRRDRSRPGLRAKVHNSTTHGPDRPGARRRSARPARLRQTAAEKRQPAAGPAAPTAVHRLTAQGALTLGQPLHGPAALAALLFTCPARGASPVDRVRRDRPAIEPEGDQHTNARRHV